MVLLNMASCSVLGMSMKAAKIAAEGDLSLRGGIGFQSSGIFVKLSEAIPRIFPVLSISVLIKALFLRLLSIIFCFHGHRLV